MTSVVYFIRNAAGHIKIGYTTDLSRRFINLSQASSEALCLLAILKGGRELEKELHTRFAEFRLQGEWFTNGESLLAFIEGIHAEASQQSKDRTEPVEDSRRRNTTEAAEEASKLLHRLSPIDGSNSERISAAATLAGLTYGRAFQLWYGRSRRIDSFELDELRRAARAHDAGFDADLIELRELIQRTNEIFDRIEARDASDD